MNKTVTTTLTLICAVLAVALPILLAIHLAHKQAGEAEALRALSYAQDVVHRTDKTADQTASGIEALVAAHAGDPCSDASVSMMRQIDVSSSYLQTIGSVSGGRLICSSVGRFGKGLDLGKVDYVSPGNFSVRGSVEFPFAKGMTFIVVERDGFAAVIHKDLPIDVSTEEKDVSLALFAVMGGRILSAHGMIKPQWVLAHLQSNQSTFFEDGYVIALVKSKRYATGAVAALPISHVVERTRHFALILVPIGLLAGIALAWSVVLLARLQLALPSVIKAALKRDEFYLVYQPIVELQTGKWVGSEALIRWKRPTGEMVRPDIFIPVAEDTGLIQEITKRVIKLVARDAQGVFQRHPQFHIAINLSSADLHSTETVLLLHWLAVRLHAAPHNIMVEATERGFIKADLTMEVIRQLREAGNLVAIDDFGTGYSSLSHLGSLKLDFLKIDKSFVDKIGTETASSDVAVHIIEIAKTLKLKMIAEGVETEAQARFLRDRGVQFAQGYLYAAPMIFSDLVAKLPSAEARGAPFHAIQTNAFEPSDGALSPQARVRV